MIRIAFFGSSLLSSYWNGAATYYRGLIAALARMGCETTFYEPDAFGRQAHRDIDPPAWARSVVFPPTTDAARSVFAEARTCDVIVKASGIGVLDDEILHLLVEHAGPSVLRVYWDVDAPATLADLAIQRDHPLRKALPRLDVVFTYGGGDPAVAAFREFGSPLTVPIYNALDPETHHPVEPDPRFACDLAFLGNRLPDREERVEEFLLTPARARPDLTFLLGGSGWQQEHVPSNVRVLGHVPTRDHNALNSTPCAVLNVARESMAELGFSPATRIFEAAGAGACLITDAWPGIADFLEPGREVLVARDGAEVAALLGTLSADRAHEIGARARARILESHTYDRRAELVRNVLERLLNDKPGRAVA